MRTARRPRRYIAPSLFVILRPAFRYSRSRDAFVLRALGSSFGPVMRVDRRSHQHQFRGADRRQRNLGERRHARAA
ncbi:MAG: hypothetical protein QOI89_672 [Solirubrobacteraceae bacterium]|jgi:hypothetical protein|nr:hypothetical protein [Solirubrobacteraceae bacterium]